MRKTAQTSMRAANDGLSKISKSAESQDFPKVSIVVFMRCRVYLIIISGCCFATTSLPPEPVGGALTRNVRFQRGSDTLGSCRVFLDYHAGLLVIRCG